MSQIAAIFIYIFLVTTCYGKIPGKIVGGTEVEIHDHPYQLTLQRWSRHTCGASIISDKWAITAGHCVSGAATSYTVGAGSKNRYNGTYYKVSRIIRHPQYNAALIDYDVAVLQIEGEFEFGLDVQPIKLASEELRQGALVNVTGWGTTSQGGRDTDNLMRVSVPIVDRKTCTEAYKTSTITNRMICAGQLESGGKDSCQGDSGGPLSANGTLYGIVSWGRGCAKPNYPGVYSNVAYLRSWIANITEV